EVTRPEHPNLRPRLPSVVAPVDGDALAAPEVEDTGVGGATVGVAGDGVEGETVDDEGARRPQRRRLPRLPGVVAVDEPVPEPGEEAAVGEQRPSADLPEGSGLSAGPAQRLPRPLRAAVEGAPEGIRAPVDGATEGGQRALVERRDVVEHVALPRQPPVRDRKSVG